MGLSRLLRWPQMNPAGRVLHGANNLRTEENTWEASKIQHLPVQPFYILVPSLHLVCPLTYYGLVLQGDVMCKPEWGTWCK